VPLDLDNAKHKGLRLYADLGDLVLSVPTENVAGGASFIDTSGAVVLDLTDARAFHHKMVGNITSLGFSNVPPHATHSAAWTWVLWIDATGGYTFAGPPAVTWLDGGSFDDLNLEAGALNIIQFIRIGASTFATFVFNGPVQLDPYKLAFLDNATILIPTETEDIDVANAQVPSGDGDITYTQNGVVITARTSFVVGDVLGVTCSALLTTTAVRIPRYLV
jgi:hypothetical protein